MELASKSQMIWPICMPSLLIMRTPWVGKHKEASNKS